MLLRTSFSPHLRGGRFSYLVSIRKVRMRQYWFTIRKRGIFRPGKEIEGLCGGVRWYAAQASPKIDAARAGKDRFRMETTYVGNSI
jgi:hypothetical protein